MTDPTIVAAVIGLVGVVLAAGITAVGVIVARLIGRIRDQVVPDGGSQDSTRHLIEQTAEDVSELKDVAATNRELATRALTMAESTAQRLDTHLLGHPTRE